MTPDTTHAQRAETAADLRDAATLIQHQGHGTGTCLAPVEGSLCLLGAIGLVTRDYGIAQSIRRLSARQFAVFNGDTPIPVTIYEAQALDKIALDSRQGRAILALADYLGPDGLEIEDGGINESVRTVYRFNDWRCAGGAGAQHVLISTAEKLEADERIDP